MKKVILVSLLIVEIYAGEYIINGLNPNVNVGVVNGLNGYTYGEIGSATIKNKFVKRYKEEVAPASTNDIKTLLPYVGMINHDSSSNKSAKDKSTLGGIYANIGNLNYLLELSYGYMNTSYKNSATENLKQHDIALIYSKYYENFMLKGGVHYVNTNDTDLGDGEILAVALGGYKYINSDVYRYGVEGYYSYYQDGHDENYVPKTVSLIQFTPYLGFFKTININNKNSINFKLNYIIANDYLTKNYTSYEISDTYYYKNLFGTLKAYFGEMKTGLKDGGITVYNSMDLIKDGYSLKVGYYMSKNIVVSASYGFDTYKEYRKTTNGTNSMALISLSYNF